MMSERRAPDQSRGRRGGGDHHAVGIADQNLTARRRGARRQRLIEFVLRLAPGVRASFDSSRRGRSSRSRQNFGDGLDVVGGVRQRRAAMVEHLHECADRDGDQKGDDQGRNRAPQSRLGGQKTPIGRLRDRLRQALDGIRSRRRTRCLSARHHSPHLDFYFQSLDPEGCAASPRITVDWNRSPAICRESVNVKIAILLLNSDADVPAPKSGGNPTDIGAISGSRQCAFGDVLDVGRQIFRRRPRAAARSRHARAARLRAPASS